MRHAVTLSSVSVPRRALRGHAPAGLGMLPCTRNGVSVPRRALRGHAPGPHHGKADYVPGFSAPKGVERACPLPLRRPLRRPLPLVSVPRRALRGHAPAPPYGNPGAGPPVSVPRRALRGHAPCSLRGRSLRISRFSAPKGVERACPMFTTWKKSQNFAFQCPEGR